MMAQIFAGVAGSDIIILWIVLNVFNLVLQTLTPLEAE